MEIIYVCEYWESEIRGGDVDSLKHSVLHGFIDDQLLCVVFNVVEAD